VLRRAGISDVVPAGELPEQLRTVAEIYAGCVSGAIQHKDYPNLMHKRMVKNVSVQKPLVIPGDMLSGYLDEGKIEQFTQGSTGIYSVTAFTQKPQTLCGDPDSGCC